MTIKVFYIHPIGAFGGASRSLCELIRGFPSNVVTAYILTQRGSVEPEMLAVGAKVISARGITKFDNTRYGYYRGWRWLLLFREIYYLPFTLAALLKARTIIRNADLIHVNEPTALPTLLLAKLFYRCPVIVHVRSMHRREIRTLRDRMTSWLLRRQAAAVIAIDRTVTASLPPEVHCHVIHNGFTATMSASDKVRPRFGDSSGLVPRLRVGLVGNFLALKGIREFMEAARMCSEQGLPVDFLLVGSNPRTIRGPVAHLLEWTGFASNVQNWVKKFIQMHKLDGRVKLMGFTTDVANIYRRIDVLCFPSYYDAPGRPVFEAAFWQAPSIVAVSNPLPDTLVHGETGLAISSSAPDLIVSAIKHFTSKPTEVERMGKNARRLAIENFDPHHNAAHVLSVYREVLERGISPNH